MTAPATFAGATPRLRAGRGGWDRDSIIQAIHEWVATHGEPPRAADWNPSAAKWAGQLWRVERYRAGRADGSPWPALNAAKRPFGGSLTEAIRAAGFEPAKPGPTGRRDVDPAQAGRAQMSPEGRAMIAAALAAAREAEARVVALAVQRDRARERADRVAAERDAARAAAARARTRAERLATTRERDEAAIRDAVASARMDAAEARDTAQRLAARLERAEATVAALRRERRRLAWDPRRLTPDELAELRTDGPAGPAVLAAALKTLAAARAGGDTPALRAALHEVARAAVTWEERL